MRITRRNLLRSISGLVPFTAGVEAAPDGYPDRPIRWIVGFTPGGATDIVARVMADWLSGRLGQRIIIENRPGASGVLAGRAVASAPPDGYTLLLLNALLVVSATISGNAGFDLQREIEPVCGLAATPLMLVSHPSIPVRTVADLTAYAKAKNGITMASYGVGSASHLAAEMLKLRTGITILHVPYPGSGGMISDLLGGQIEIAFDSLPSAKLHIQTGAVRAIGVASLTRVEDFPEVPSLAESLPGFEAVTWGGVGVPKGTPLEIIARLDHEIRAGLLNPQTRARLIQVGMTPMISPTADFAAYITAETKKWTDVARSAGLSPG